MRETHVDCYTLAPETTRTTDAMNIVFTIAYAHQVSALTQEGLIRRTYAGKS